MGVVQEMQLSAPTLTATNSNLGSPDSILRFYDDANILITGGTGFVGKALTAKLLKTCESVRFIYLLMRVKKGKDINERLEDLLKSPVFDVIRDKNPDIFKKVRAIAGDVLLPNLGISKRDRHFIYTNINIVFHSAATIKFNEALKTAFQQNTLGTERLLQICKKMKFLKSFVYVSTAFSNADKMEIKEAVYKPAYDPNALLKCIDILPEVFTKRLLGKHPNTYTLTKGMAEYIVSEKSSVIPATIVRPSIIIPAWKEPFPGWVDNFGGITGILMEIGRGTINSCLCVDDYFMESIPIDVTVNTLITAAWHSSVNRTNTVKVYNCVSGPINGATWHDFKIFGMKYCIEYPSKYVTWYPSFSYQTNEFIHVMICGLFHFIPSALLDVFRILSGKKPMMLKINNRFHTAVMNGSFFSLNQWDFEVSEMRQLIKAVNQAQDGHHFHIDMTDFDWDECLKNFILGIRQYVLKDDLKSLPSARRKLRRLYWFRQVIIMFFVFISINMVLKLSQLFFQ